MKDLQKSALRQWRLIRLLSDSPNGLTLKTLSEKLKVAPRTVNRDLATLRDAGLSLQKRAEAHGLKYWTLTEKNPEQSPVFLYDEAASLYLARHFLEPLMGTFLWEAADSALTIAGGEKSSSL